MCPFKKATTLAGRYDQALLSGRQRHLPLNAPRPVPTGAWPEENIRLLEKYNAWLLDGGTAEYATHIIYLPMAGHILGMNPIPHQQINLEGDFERALDYVRAKQVSADWLKACRNGLEKFRRFMRLERGLGEINRSTPYDIPLHTQDLPAWLVLELERFQHTQQRNWRAARIEQRICQFWGDHIRIWRFLCVERGVSQLADLKRQHILDYVDMRLGTGRAIMGVNGELHTLHSFLLFLQDEGCLVPQSVLRIPSLKVPDSLPKYLTDEQVIRLRDEIERCARQTQPGSHRRMAWLVRAAFYLMWQCGLRLGEVEELRLEDLDLSGKRLSVRESKGKKDRTIYLTEHTIQALQAYLEVRGNGLGGHVFLYRNATLKKDLLSAKIKSAGQRVAVNVYPHRLRHTCATQLLNAGCRITSIQRYLGHKKLNTTLIYARAHDQTVADDYFAAMQRIERRLNVMPPGTEPDDEVFPERAQLLAWVEILAQPELGQNERIAIAWQLKQALAGQFAPPALPVAMSVLEYASP